MAIGTDAAIEVFGTTDALDDASTSSISDGAMSVAADITPWTNDDDAPLAQLVLLWQYPSGTIDGHINIHVRPINIDGTNDPPAPTASNQLGYAGSFQISPAQTATTDTVYTQIVSLQPFSTKTSQEYEFYLFNDAGVTVSANWDLDIIPKTFEPAV